MLFLSIAMASLVAGCGSGYTQCGASLCCKDGTETCINELCARPDYKPITLTVPTNSVPAGTSFDVTINITNIGTGPALQSSYAAAWQGSSVYGTIISMPHPLSPGESLIWNGQLNCTTFTDDMPVSVEVDYDEDINESNEFNNVKATTVHCVDQSSPRQPDYIPLVTVVPSTPLNLGQPYAVYVTTKNIGLGDAHLNTISSIHLPDEGGTMWGGFDDIWQVYPPLKATETQVVSYQFTCQTAGDKNFTVVVDLNNDLGEANESNNVINITVTCGTPTACGIPVEYVAPSSSSNPEETGVSPMGAIQNLEAGTSISGGRGGAVVGATSGFYKAGWFSDWKAMGFIGVAIVCAIIALAAMIGRAFNLPEVKAFANTELRQAVISVLLIVSLLAIVSFLDEIARQAIYGADLPISCSGSEPCYITSAKYYLSTLYNTSNEYAENELSESISIMKRASYGYNLNFNKIYFLFAGISIRTSAGDSLIAERHGALFSQVAKIMASIYAQKYFIDVITFGIAPLFILLGVVLRTFFFTRKLGGLFLAMAISLFIVYPLTFAFAWYTLNVTVYGERTLAVSDPACPSECTGTYPVAFFANSSGQLIQFSTIQDIVDAGITRDNWRNNGPGGTFIGLVACQNLTTIGINSVIAPNSCSECPVYCRDVPFPTSMPGCNITKCAACNPGCKITRQRSDCETTCSGKCPINCRIRVPTENKCFNDELGGSIPANLSVNCGGCSKYPVWCRYLKIKTVDGIEHLEPFYNNTMCKNGTVDIANDTTCPSQCSYITRLGSDAACDSLCSVGGVVCPEECRVTNLYDPAWAAIYDVSSLSGAAANFTSLCNLTPEMGNACAQCRNNYPECMMTVPAAPSNCAPYPTNGYSSQKCLDCPEYCRYSSGEFTSMFASNYSNVIRDISSLPNVCNPSLTSGLNCSASGSSPACSASCQATALPLICRAFNSSDTNTTYCRKCPEEARVMLHFKSGSIDELTIPLLKNSYQCSNANCSAGCKSTIIELPNEDTDPTCVPEGVVGGSCPYGCRVRGIDTYFDSSYCSNHVSGLNCSAMSPLCFVTLSGEPQGQICSEYLGNGAAPANAIPIDERASPYEDRTGCRQCPEQCRLDGYYGDCGVENNGNNVYVDCSDASCPSSCRAPALPAATKNMECLAPQSDSTGTSCKDCPALCRRSTGIYVEGCPTASCMLSSDPATGCSDSCRLEDPPTKACAGCFDCDLDCSYYPAIRSDCADICTDEALAGPVNIAPDDFIKALPGAKTAFPEERNIGVLYIPAVLLPLFCIVIVVAFIRVFSPILGGDIEIPGLGKII